MARPTTITTRFLPAIALLFLASLRCLAASDVGGEFRRLADTDGKILLDRVYKFLEHEQYDSALVYYSVVANRHYSGKSSRKDIENYITAMQNIGIIYMTCDYDYRKAYDCLLQAEELAEANHCYKSLPNIYNSIASILQLSGQYGNETDNKEMVTMLRKSFDMAAKTGNSDAMALALDNLMALGIGKDGRKLDLSRETELFNKTCARVKSRETELTRMMSQAYSAYAKGDNTTAADIIEKVKKSDGGYPLAYRETLMCNDMLTRMYLGAKEYGKAVVLAKASLNIAKKNNSMDYAASIYSCLSDTYRAMGDSAAATRCELLYLRTNEKLYFDGNLSTVKSVKFARELNKADEQVRLLSEKRCMQNMLLVGAAAVIAIIAALLYRLYRANRKIRQNNRHLYRANVELLAKESEARKMRQDAETTIGQLQEKVRSMEAPQQKQYEAAEGDTANAAEKQQRKKYMGSRMTDEEAKQLYSAILRTMENSAEIFRIGFNVDRLSELVHSRARYVSQAINQESGSNFNTLLNEYRIKEACRRLNGNPQYANMTIESIAESVGFKSRTSFGALFKSMTGLSPSAYQAMANGRT